MDPLQEYSLVMLDFDGLLVNTEKVHFEAYQIMMRDRGFDLGWDFSTYCKIAHYHSSGLEQKIYEENPKLKALEPRWDVLYQEKKRALSHLFESGEVELMPGVEEFLSLLKERGMKRCVVTHSPRDVVDKLVKHHDILGSIPVWFSREDYPRAKPAPDGYLHAISVMAKPYEKVIGFEDTPRGIYALQGSRAQPVLVSQIDYPEISEFKKQGVIHYLSFVELLGIIHSH